MRQKKEIKRGLKNVSRNGKRQKEAQSERIINSGTLYQERQQKHSEEWTHTEDTAVRMFVCIFTR